MSILAVSHATYTYPQRSVPAVKDVSFFLAEGAYTAIVGLNGSGKSTLARMLCGLLDADEGSITYAENVRPALVFQSPKDQIICSVVSRDTAFGPQNLGLDAGEVELRTIECLNITGLLSKASSPSMSLSLGQTQKEALSGILALQPDVLVLDEAVSMLDPQSRSDIFRFLSYWVSKNHTVIHITHDIDAIRQVQNVIVMNEGSVVFDGSKDSFFADTALCTLITGGKIEKADRSLVKNDAVSFAFEKISFSYGSGPVLRDVTFSLRKGTVTALTGVSGSGKSTLLEIAAGLLVPEEGAVHCDVRPALCQQNNEAALFERFAADDVAFGLRNRGISGKELVSRVKSAMDACGIPFDTYGERQTFGLSGGEKKRLSVAGIIVLDTPVLFFDEPTAGLDGVSRGRVMRLLRALADGGHTILFSTHRRDEADFADREISLIEGTVVRDTDAAARPQPVPAVVQPPLGSVKLLTSLRAAAVNTAGTEKNAGLIACMNPLLKFIVFFGLFALSLAVRPLYLCALLFGLSLVYAALARYPAKRLFLSLLKVIPLLFFFCIFQMIFYPAVPGERVFVPYKYFMVTPSKLMLCLTTLIHTEAALVCIVSFTYTTPEYDVVDGLSSLLKPLAFFHVPVRYVVVVVEIIFRFIPLLIDESSSIIKTQLIRGGLGRAKGAAGRIKAIIPLFVPLVIQTMKRAEALADAMTERYFS
jgi:energy-coupling factor transport system permease/ATP-binding protein